MAHDAQTAMVVVSMVASALAVVALYFLGRSMFGRRIGLVGALLLATSPLFWFYGEIALPHTLDILLVIVGVWWLYEVMVGNHRYLYPAIAIIAVAGGVRQQTLVFLIPLLLFALRRVGWNRFLIAGVWGVVICLAWFVPLIALSGGWANYMRVMGVFARRFQDTTSVFMGAGWSGIRYNVRRVAIYTLYGWSAATAPAVVYAFKAAVPFRWREWAQRWEKTLFLILWVAPALIFYAIIHMGQQGLVFVFLPALFLVSAVGLVRLLNNRSSWLMGVTVLLVVLNAGIFCLMSEYPLGPDTQRLLTRATLVNSDRYYQDRFSAIEENLTPESTAILAINWHHVEYYLPGYVMLPFGTTGERQGDEGSPTDGIQEVVATPDDLGLQLDDQGQVVIAVFDPDLMAYNEGGSPAKVLPLQHGGRLEYLVLTEGHAFHYGTRSFGISTH
jgi:hypothetical protein